MNARTILLVTHSSRPFMDARAHFNAFEQRFSNRHLDKIPPLESFPGLDSAVPFDGRLTIWEIDNASVGSAVPNVQLLGTYAPGYAVNSATFAGDHLVVCGGDRVEVLDSELKVVKTIRDGWIASCHTVAAEDEKHVWLSSAAANAVLRVDIIEGRVVERLSMPLSYGLGHALTPDDDLCMNFVPTDWQPTHVNAAYPYRNGVLVTLWIQGAVGFFDAERNYTEIIRGYTGCHGARILPGQETIILSDSAAGIIWWLDAGDGSIRRRIAVDTKWLHDAVPLGNGLVAATISDQNSIRILDEKSGETRAEIDASPFGATTKFVACSLLPYSWRNFADADPMAEKLSSPQIENMTTIDLADLIPMDANRLQVTQKSMTFTSSMDEESGYLASFGRTLLAAGTWRLKGAVQMTGGAISIGVLDVTRDHWCAQLHFDRLSVDGDISFHLEETRLVDIILCADNHIHSTRITGRIKDLSLTGPEKGEVLLGEPEITIPGKSLRPAWGVFCASDAEGRLFVHKKASTTSKLFKKSLGTWEAGTYFVAIDGEAVDGRVEVGVIGPDRKWVGNTRLDSSDGSSWLTFDLLSAAKVSCVGFAANETNTLSACRVYSIRVWKGTS